MKIKDLFNLLYDHLQSPNKVAMRKGVKIGLNCHLRTIYFGSEPYLISMGDQVATAAGVRFITHDGAIHVLRNLFDDLKNSDLIDHIDIGNNVFIGLNAIILLGTKIGNNVIIGAGSIVKGQIKSNSVYAGIPAKFICSIEDYKLRNEKNIMDIKNLNNILKKSFLENRYYNTPQK